MSSSCLITTLEADLYCYWLSSANVWLLGGCMVSNNPIQLQTELTESVCVSSFKEVWFCSQGVRRRGGSKDIISLLPFLDREVERLTINFRSKITECLSWG